MLGDSFQTEVAQIALTAAAPHGFALAGGQALIAHNIVSRPTEDIDLFTDVDHAAESATEPVQRALEAAGLEAQLIAETTELGEVFYGFDSDMVEFEVSRGTDMVRLTLARFDRALAPVTLDIGTVLHLDDVLGSKVAAMATRAEPRDFVDVAAALRRYPADDLLCLAYRADPSLTTEEFEESMRYLDRLPDSIFMQWIAVEGVVGLREAFEVWPRGVA